MSLATRQQTCAACAKPLAAAPVNIEPLIDDIVRYVVVCWTCHTFTRRTPSPNGH